MKCQTWHYIIHQISVSQSFVILNMIMHSQDVLLIYYAYFMCNYAWCSWIYHTSGRDQFFNWCNTHNELCWVHFLEIYGAKQRNRSSFHALILHINVFLLFSGSIHFYLNFLSGEFDLILVLNIGIFSVNHYQFSLESWLFIEMKLISDLIERYTTGMLPMFIISVIWCCSKIDLLFSYHN